MDHKIKLKKGFVALLFVTAVMISQAPSAFAKEICFSSKQLKQEQLCVDENSLPDDDVLTISEPKEEIATPQPADYFYVVLGSFSKQANADRLKKRLAGQAKILIARAIVKDRRFFRVLAGPNTRQDAARLKHELETREKQKYWVLKMRVSTPNT